MTATIRRPEHQPGQPRPKRRQVRFSFMESLGFIESPATVSQKWMADEAAIPEGQTAAARRGAHERTIADLEPIDTTQELFQPNLRRPLVVVIVVVLGTVLGTLAWLSQRPDTVTGNAIFELSASVNELAPQLESLERLTSALSDPRVDNSTIHATSLSVDERARALFNVAAKLPDSEPGLRTMASDVANKAIDASRLISNAAAYRAAVVQILVAPPLETDPALVALDDAIRQFGTWRMSFDQVRSALPSGSMPTVSAHLDGVSNDLEALQNRYIDSLREDDRQAAAAVILELQAQLDIAETLLAGSLATTQEEVSRLIEESRAGIDRLLG